MIVQPAPWSNVPPHVRRRGHVAFVCAVVAGICAALIAAVLHTLASVPEVLPVPRVVARDPVPPERIVWNIPADCGVSDATIRALTPDPADEEAEDRGNCGWSATGRDLPPEYLVLDVTITESHAGPGVADVTDADNASDSSVGVAMSDFGAIVNASPRARPVTGLGDEAGIVKANVRDPSGRDMEVFFRTGNTVVTVAYVTHGSPYDDRRKPPADGVLRAGALRAATDVARTLRTAQAAPKIAPPEPSVGPAAVRVPGSVCAIVPRALRHQLLRKSSPYAGPGTRDPDGAGGALPAARARTCDLQTATRNLTIAITTTTAPTAARDLGREYLRRYLEARAQRPVSTTDERYFHPLAGLGDQAFAAYLEESGDIASDVSSPAHIVVRTGGALISVTYGAKRGDGSPGDVVPPLTREEAVTGAYAIAVRAVRAVRP